MLNAVLWLFQVEERTAPLFQSRLHKQVPRQVIEKRFRILCNLVDVRRVESSPCQPSIHDLWHSFAVHRLTEWYRKDKDAQALLPALSTYSVMLSALYATLSDDDAGASGRGEPLLRTLCMRRQR